MSNKLGMAYAMQKYRAKKMADGGPVTPEPQGESAADKFVRGFKKKINGFADGGMASNGDWAGMMGANAAGNKGIHTSEDWANVTGANEVAPAASKSSALGRIGAGLKGFGQGMTAAPNSLSAFNSFARMAQGGIAKAIRAQKMAMSMGGEVSDDFLSAEMEPEEIPNETYPDPDQTEDPSETRRGRISKIMSGLHSRHFGKK